MSSFRNDETLNLQCFKNMSSLKKTWKNNWDLESIDKVELYNVVQGAVAAHLNIDSDNLPQESSSLAEEYDADSVDLVTILLQFDELFKPAIEASGVTIPTDKLGEIVLFEDLFDVVYEAVRTMETKIKEKGLPLSILRAPFKS